MRRTRSVLAATAASTLLLSACATGTSQGSGESADVAADAGTGEDLTIMGFGLDDEIGQVRFDLAEQAVDGTTVNLSEGGLDMQQFLSAVASGNPPALIRADRTQIGTLASRGAIMPLDQCLTEHDVNVETFVPSSIDQVTFDEQIYGIPEFSSVQLTMANQQLLDAEGLTLEDVNGSDPQRVLEANRALTRSEGGNLTVLGYDSKMPEFLPLWVHARGGTMISEDGRTATLDSPEVLDALTWAVQVYEDQGGFGTVKAVRDSADFFGSGNQFAAGTLGAMPMENWYVNVLNEVSPDAPVVFDTVRDTAGEPIAYTSGSAWAIPSGSQNAADACTFATTMVATDTWLAAAQARAEERAQSGQQFTGLLTANTEADQRIREEMVTPSGEENWDAAVEAIYSASENTFAFPANPADAEFQTAWKDAVNRVLNGQQEPAEALAQGQEEAQAALDTAWEDWDAGQDAA